MVTSFNIYSACVLHTQLGSISKKIIQLDIYSNIKYMQYMSKYKMNEPSSICHPFQSSQRWEISLQLHSSNTIAFVLLRLVLSSNGMYFSFLHLV